MRNTLFYFLVILAVVGCSTPQKSFENQNYEKAFKLSLKKVKNKKATRKDREILLESLRRILAENNREINIWEEGPTPKEWGKALKYIATSQNKIRKAEPYVRYDFSKMSNNLRDKKNKITGELYAFYLRRGKQDLDFAVKNGDKYAAQSAYNDFQTAKKYTGRTNILDSLQQVCLEHGKITYSIRSDAPFGMNWEVNRTFERLENESDRFLDVFYDRAVSNTDCEIEIDFRDFDIDYGRRIVKNLTFEKEVEAGFRTEIDTAGNEIRIPIYETVFGYVQVEELNKTAVAEIWINVYSNSKNCKLSDDRIEDRVVNIVERTQITGDRRAVPSDYDDRFQDNLADDDDLAEELIDLLYTSIRNRIFN